MCGKCSCNFTSFGDSFVKFQVVLAKLSKLVDMALGHIKKPPSFDLDAKPLNSLDVHEKPPPIVKLANAQHPAQLSTTFFMDNPLGFILAYVMKL